MAPRYSLEDYEIPDMFTPTPEYIAQSMGLDPEVFSAMVSTESDWNPNAVSPAGAIGPAQLMPSTAAELGVDPYDPVQNLYGGARYLKDRINDNNGDTLLGAAAYNAGQGAVDKFGGVPPFEETQGYVSKIGEKLGLPLPAMPSLGTPSASRANSGVVAPVSKLRTEAYDQLANEIQGLEKTKDEAIGRINNSGSLDTNDTIAMALTAILPTLIGMGFQGRQGAAVGAEAGRAGAEVGLKGIQANITGANETNKAIFNDAQQRLSQKQSQLQQTRDAMADRTERNDELDSLYGSGGIRRGVTAATQSFSPEIASIIAKAQQGITPSQSELSLAATVPGASKMINDSLRSYGNLDIAGKRVAQGDRSLDLRERQGDERNDIAKQRLDNTWALTKEKLAMQDKFGNQRMLNERERIDMAKKRNDDYALMVQNSNERAKDRIALTDRLAGRIPPADLKEITGKDTMLQNYKELASLVTERGEDFDAERVGAALGEVMDQFKGREKDEFDAAEWSGLFNRLAATYGIDPNSYNFRVLQRMEQIGRANAIAQPGVATNQDALSETNFVRILPGQSVDSYLENLTLQAEQKRRELAAKLQGLETNGYASARPFMQKYGVASDNLGSGSSETPKLGADTIVVGGKTLRLKEVR